MIRKLMRRLSARSLVRSLERGKFYKVLDRDKLEDWRQFMIRQASIPHNERIVLRITINKHDPWYIWIVYKVISTNPPSMSISEIYGPAEEHAKLMTPEDLDGLDYFAA